MSKEENRYPVFTANQILTHDQLNDLRDHLSQQDRLSRVRLCGIGVLCGLTVEILPNETEPVPVGSVEQSQNPVQQEQVPQIQESLKNSGVQIKISPGYGMTSDGHLLEFPGATLERYTSCTSSGESEEKKSPYPPEWEDVKELTVHTDKADDLNLLELSVIQGHIVVLYLKQQENQPDSCIAAGCKTQGKTAWFTVKPLLVKREHFTEAAFGCSPVEKHLLHLPRLHTSIPLENICDPGQINEHYRKIIEVFFAENEERIKRGLKGFAAVVHTEESGRLLDDLKNTVLLSDNSSVQQVQQQAQQHCDEISQYHYDLLKDFVQTYNKLVKATHSIRQACQATENFPRHLVLGAVDGGFKADNFRNYFTSSAAHILGRDGGEEVRRLYKRLVRIAQQDSQKDASDSRTEQESHGLVITPGQSGSETKPFDNEYAACSFFHIQGHLGLPLDEAVKAIREQRRQHNLEFELLVLHFAENNAEGGLYRFNRFAAKVNGMEHTGGVEKGGTFILVQNRRTVIADFSLAGQVYLNREDDLERCFRHLTDRRRPSICQLLHKIWHLPLFDKEVS